MLPSANVADYAVSEAAERELEKIYESGIGLFGVEQAQRYLSELTERFQLLAEFPGIGGPEFSVRRRKVRRFPFGSHVIIYADIKNGVRILRVLHCRTDWRRELRRQGI
jgi:toxin ParE1/3/4